MNLQELILEWNWDFDPSDQKSLSFAVNEMMGYLNEQDVDYVTELLRPFISEGIVRDQEAKIALDEEWDRQHPNG